MVTIRVVLEEAGSLVDVELPGVPQRGDEIEITGAAPQKVTRVRWRAGKQPRAAVYVAPVGGAREAQIDDAWGT